MEKKNRGSSDARALHLFAGVLLLIFAVSHFLMATVPVPSNHSISTVFPFLRMWALFVFAGLFELSVAAICLKNYGRDIANFAILTFIVVMVWYHWALPYTGGGKTCQCVGILGHALHLTKTQEKVVPVIVLCLLTITIIPWLLRRLFENARYFFQRASHLVRHVSLILLALVAWQCNGQETVQVSGKYHCFPYFPKTGVPYTNDITHAAFTYTVSGKAWSLYATNIDTNPEGAGFRTPWEGLIYDGTNLFTMMPYHAEAQGRNWTIETELGKGSAVRTTISPGPFFNTDFDEYLNFYAIWITYGLHPGDLKKDKNGLIEIVLPWYTSTRNTPLSHGFEWQISPSEDGRFISQCVVLSNTNLDRGDDAEMLRTDVDFPENLGARNRFTELLELRRLNYPNHYIQADYKCQEWYHTNGFTLPMRSEFKVYANFPFTNFYPNSPLTRANIEAEKVTVRKGNENLLPSVVTNRTLVADYRYRKEFQGHICAHVDYVLAPGDSWKSDNDPALVRKAMESLGQFSPQFGYAKDKRRSHLTWLLLVAILVPALLFLRPKKSIK
jgi:hypothetical protein